MIIQTRPRRGLSLQPKEATFQKNSAGRLPVPRNFDHQLVAKQPPNLPGQIPPRHLRLSLPTQNHLLVAPSSGLRVPRHLKMQVQELQELVRAQRQRVVFLQRQYCLLVEEQKREEYQLKHQIRQMVSASRRVPDDFAPQKYQHFGPIILQLNQVESVLDDLTNTQAGLGV